MRPRDLRDRDLLQELLTDFWGEYESEVEELCRDNKSRSVESIYIADIIL